MTAVALAPRPNADRDRLSPNPSPAVEAEHPSTGPRLPVENDAYAAMVGRMIRAYARRVAAGDPEDLARMLELRDAFDAAIGDAVVGLRDQWGASWTDIGRVAGMTRQSAREKWGS